MKILFRLAIVAAIILAGLYFLGEPMIGEDPIDQMLDNMETTVVALEKLVYQLEQGAVTALGFEQRAEELYLEFMELEKEYGAYDFDDLSPEQMNRLKELGKRIDDVGNNTAVRMMQYYYY